MTLASASAQPTSETICAAAAAYLRQTGTPPQDGMLLATNRITSGSSWKREPDLILGKSEIKVSENIDKVYISYFLSRDTPTAGALSARIALLITDARDRTNYIDVFRPAIARGYNRCEPRGRVELERRVRVNEYIDYHDPAARGVSSTLEDFHFSYPVGADGTGSCKRTDDAKTSKSFLFENVSKTKNESLISRLFSITGTAYAINHDFSILRSELHYRQGAASLATCFGFLVPVGNAQKAQFVINLHGFDDEAVPKTWIITRDKN
jgi:hypothetical protein